MGRAGEEDSIVYQSTDIHDTIDILRYDTNNAIVILTHDINA